MANIRLRRIFIPDFIWLLALSEIVLFQLDDTESSSTDCLVIPFDIDFRRVVQMVLFDVSCRMLNIHSPVRPLRISRELPTETIFE